MKQNALHSTASSSLRALMLILCLQAIVWGCWAACRFGDYRVAYSPSVPIGLYRIEQQPVARGDYVMFCPPPGALFTQAVHQLWIAAGECPAGTRALMKLVVAVEGDHVLFRDDGAYVNGQAVPNSSVRTKDARGVALPRPVLREVVLAPGDYVLMSRKGPDSFDARYFGALHAEILGRLEPIITWDM